MRKSSPSLVAIAILTVVAAAPGCARSEGPSGVAPRAVDAPAPRPASPAGSAAPAASSSAAEAAGSTAPAHAASSADVPASADRVFTTATIIERNESLPPESRKKIKRWVLAVSDGADVAPLFREVWSTTTVNGMISLPEYVALVERNDIERLAQIRARSPRREIAPPGSPTRLTSLEGPLGLVELGGNGMQYQGAALAKLAALIRSRGKLTEGPQPPPVP